MVRRLTCVQVSESATGTTAIGEALRSLQLGDADVMLAGGSEAAVTALGFAGYNARQSLTTTGNESPQTASKPFDKARDGFVMGEGAGVLLLETEEHAKARGARIYCELAGCAPLPTPSPTPPCTARAPPVHRPCTARAPPVHRTSHIHTIHTLHNIHNASLAW
jgi:hypothetical protein